MGHECPTHYLLDLDAPTAAAFCGNDGQRTVGRRRDSMKVFQDGNIIGLDLRRRHGIICQDVFGFHGSGESHVIHPFLIFIHLVFVPIQNDHVFKFEAFGRMNGGDNEVGSLRIVVAFCLLVLSSQQGLFDGVVVDFVFDHVVFHEFQHVTFRNLAGADLVNPGCNDGRVFGFPVVQHVAYTGCCFLCIENQELQMSHDLLVDDIDDVGVRLEGRFVPILLDEQGHDGCVVHLFGYQAGYGFSRILFFQDLFDRGNIPPGERQNSDGFISAHAAVDVAAHLVAENHG